MLKSFLCLLVAILSLHPLSAEPLVKDGDKVAFLGDSITAAGVGGPGGYAKLVQSGLKVNGINITVIPAGVSGNKSDQMLVRLKKDVLDKKPTWMTLSCGVNDVWHQERGKGIELEAYRKNITEIVDMAQADGVKVLVFTATLIGEDLNNVSNGKSVAYNDFLRQLAQEKKLPLADLNQAMRNEWKAIQDAGSPEKLTTDGVHMTYLGNLMMARGVLLGFGLNESELAKAEEAWGKIPGLIALRPVSITLEEKVVLEKRAGKAGVQSYLDALYKKLIADEVAAARGAKP